MPEGDTYSVAWDWVFTGVSTSSLHEELLAPLIAARLNARDNVPSLGVTELCVIGLTKNMLANYQVHRAHERQHSTRHKRSLGEMQGTEPPATKPHRSAPQEPPAEAAQPAPAEAALPKAASAEAAQPKAVAAQPKAAPAEAPQPKAAPAEAAQPKAEPAEADAAPAEAAQPKAQARSESTRPQTVAVRADHSDCSEWFAPWVESTRPTQRQLRTCCSQAFKGLLGPLNFMLKTNKLQERPMICNPEHIDTWVGMENQSIDPYLVEGFECKICSAELSQRYAHCKGCEVLLQRDYNICLKCYMENAPVKAQEVGAPAQISSRHHAPVAKRRHYESRKKTPCEECRKCVCCECVCHTQFEIRLRFDLPNERARLLEHTRLALKDQPLPAVQLQQEFPRTSHQQGPSRVNKSFSKAEKRPDLAAT
eukprot:TRINITY_DN9273_c0_g1_i4.p1 TRINITY_DN9273_c0_g1~~TRINITY_DN9273_c0_g1_i4.p1  ORF type:complete len:423 (+),score=123.94 TRINITY_DN9273_c0_g1_i4:1272-2540(+)